MNNKLLEKLIEMLILGEPSKSEEEATAIEATSKKPLVGEYCIIRCRDAGVHAGYVEDWYDRTVILKESRRLWFWKCKSGHSLSGLAESGLHSDSKIPAVVSTIVLTDACEIIPASMQFEEDCKNAPIHNT